MQLTDMPSVHDLCPVVPQKNSLPVLYLRKRGMGSDSIQKCVWNATFIIGLIDKP